MFSGNDVSGEVMLTGGEVRVMNMVVEVRCRAVTL